jgi:D-cysteine desulfhydrase
MARAPSLKDLDALPQIGWVRSLAPAPVTSLGALADRLGLGFVGVKRDDLLGPLHGGTKVRKLDYALAAPPFVGAEAWVTIGGIGSGNAVALTAAAAELGKRVEAHLFWTPLSPGVTDNLAFVASGPTTITFYGSRTRMAIARPGLLLGDTLAGAPVLAPGSSSGSGMLGLVRAGLELGAQIEAGELPLPDRIYVAFGSGGTAVGLSLGLAMAGVRTEIIAVATVERALSTRLRVRSLVGTLRAALLERGLSGVPEPVPLRVEHRHLGEGYAFTTEESQAACAALGGEGIALEQVYTGKAMAALLADAKALPKARVLFWNTVRRDDLPPAPDYLARLPPALAERLVAAASGKGRRVPRRRVLAAVVAAGAVGVAARVTGYAPLAWEGRVLFAWEALVLVAAAEAFLSSLTSDERASLAARVDRYLLGMPPATLREVHGMFALIEHGTTPLGGRLRRFTNLPAAERVAFLDGLEARGGVLALASRSLRDLCMVGYYQQPSTWAEIGYAGPLVPLTYDPRGPERAPHPAYDALVAPPGATPRGLAP